jgi:hypothetical protein
MAAFEVNVTPLQHRGGYSVQIGVDRGNQGRLAVSGREAD